MKEVMNNSKLDPAALGLSLGIVWGASMLISGLIAYYFAYGKHFAVAMSAMYFGYEPSIIGSIIGGAFGFVDGLIVGAVLGYLYNGFSDGWVCCRPNKNRHKMHVHNMDAHHETHAHKPKRPRKVIK